MELAQLLGDLHPRLVQFPVVLLLTGLLFDAAGLVWRNERAHWAGRLLLCFGTVALLVAFICGIFAEIFAGRAGVPHHQIKWHELVATAAAWGFVALAVWRLFLRPSRRGLMTLYVVLGLGLFALLGIAAHLGGDLVFEYGAAVRGAEADTILSLHDLNTLAQRQTDLNLRYSDRMHHIFGWLVLALSATLLIRELSPRQAHRLRWIGPMLFLCGGVFLLFFADLDLYRLGDVRQLFDREVQMHKLISLIMIGVGICGLVLKPKAAAAQKTEAEMQAQNRLIAGFALVGGGLLFTHVHTVAPYANVAAGVYLNHIVMGLVALAIGAAKLFDDLLPHKTKWRALVFPSLMAAQGLFLITYTEGLPWFLGYGHYNRWGANGGCIAPYGRMRAEMVYDPATAQMDVRVLERFADAAVRVPTTNLTVLVGQRYKATSVPLVAVDADGAGAASHFRGRALFLKDALQFSARTALPFHGRWKMGWFEPWVTPALSAVPPNVVARFVCPMHEGIRSDVEGDCRLCGMPLVPIQNTPPTTLHDPKYAMAFLADPEGIAAGQTVTLKFTPKQAGNDGVVRDLVVVHEHLFHLIVVSADLSYFDHVHPTPQPDGSFTVPYKFPHGGNFFLFAEITPGRERSQVFRLSVTVAGTPPPPKRLRDSPALAREIGRYHVDLVLQPRELTAERHVNFAFRVSRDGKPVTDLQPYIGAMGHCVVISEDTEQYVHCHPEQWFTPPSADSRGGPEVAFHTSFAKPGRYKIWGQFRHRDEILVADFTVSVEPPILPLWLVNFLIFD